MKNFMVCLISALTFCSLALSCTSDDPMQTEQDVIQIMFASEFCDAINSGNENYVESEVNALCIDLLPQSTDSDALGHEANLNKLIERLDMVDCLSASLGCYACIETFPLTSEIFIELPTSDKLFVIDLRTPGDGILVFSGMH